MRRSSLSPTSNRERRVERPAKGVALATLATPIDGWPGQSEACPGVSEKSRLEFLDTRNEGSRRGTRVLVQNLSQRLTLALLIVFSIATQAFAQDIVDRKGAGAVRGEIVASSRTEVTVKVAGKPDVKIPANEITRVRFSGEKPQVNLIRSEEAAGKLRKALDGYRDALRDTSATQANLKTDLEFLVARTTAKLAAEDPKMLDDALKALESFRSAHPDNFRDFETLVHLGNVQLAKKDFDKARVTFEQLSQSPWNDYKLAARNAAAKILLTENKVDDAIREYESVIQSAGTEPADASRRIEAMLGKAAGLERKNDFAQAAQTLEQIIEQSGENDDAVQAEACVRLGGAFQSAGNVRDALLSYLRVDVLFFNQKNSHAESLYHLSQLWARDGKPDRAADAATVLQAKYPESEWAKKLSSKTTPETR